ncbi:2,4-dihydroxyhept-2-ene-1,7-dioic acid aldolase [Desulfovibrio sp. OttesenSCG-928-M14]|nr:2,4-dihydroxyhept-2-ene-1,7-dioic acid aldolase [Desulfovibrio sp. OttesenSCG-928-M14]
MSCTTSIRRMLREKQITVGTWLQLPCPDAAEIMARMGYDWAAVDMEHGAFGRANLPDMFRALERWGTVPFVRVAEASLAQIKYALDSGAHGLIFPMIESRNQLDEAIALALYPGGKDFTQGKRGVGFCRANAFGLDFAAHTAQDGLGQDITLVAQIEHVSALPELDAIFGHPRLDACMVGPYDLSASMGLTGRFEHQEFKAAMAHIEAKAKEHGLASGVHVVQPDPDVLRERIRQGHTFIAYGIDSIFLQAAGKRPEIKV